MALVAQHERWYALLTDTDGHIFGSAGSALVVREGFDTVLGLAIHLLVGETGSINLRFHGLLLILSVGTS